MSSIGEKLRQERLRRGLDLNQIAELTKINAPMLEAIEEDDFDRLPGTFFARSFVRQYAQALGLDEDEFESELRRVAGFGHPAEDQPEPPVPAPAPRPTPIRPRRSGADRRSLSSLVVFLAIAAACTIVYGLWQRAHAPSARTPQAASVREQPSPVPLAETPTPPAAETPSPTATPLESPSPEAGAPPSAETTPQQGLPAAASPDTAGVRLELRATSEAWVRVVSDEKAVYSGVLQPNEARVFEGTKLVTLRVGNAAALAATYNGKPLGELGSEGQVRTIQFTPSGYSFVTPAPSASPTPSAPAEP